MLIDSRKRISGNFYFEEEKRVRKINITDVFKFSRIIKKSGIREDLKDMFNLGKNSDNNENDIKELGINVAFTIIENFSDEKIEKEFYELLASIAEKETETIKNQSLETTISMIVDISKENNLVIFFKEAFRFQMK